MVNVTKLSSCYGISWFSLFKTWSSHRLPFRSHPIHSSESFLSSLAWSREILGLHNSLGSLLYLYRTMTCFIEDNLIMRHPNGYLISNPICPKSVFQSIAAILPIGLHNLFQYPLNLSIWNLGLPVSVEGDMVWKYCAQPHTFLEKPTWICCRSVCLNH